MIALPALAAAGPLQDDLAARRARVMEKLGPDAIAIFSTMSGERGADAAHRFATR